MSELLHLEITKEIIGAAIEVWKVLGYGFLEKVYENATAEEVNRRGLVSKKQVSIEVSYKGVTVGLYVADLLVEGSVIVEFKAENELNLKHQAQMINYLKATGIRVGLLVNFGEGKCEWKRLVV